MRRSDVADAAIASSAAACACTRHEADVALHVPSMSAHLALRCFHALHVHAACGSKHLSASCRMPLHTVTPCRRGPNERREFFAVTTRPCLDALAPRRQSKAVGGMQVCTTQQRMLRIALTLSIIAARFIAADAEASDAAFGGAAAPESSSEVATPTTAVPEASSDTGVESNATLPLGFTGNEAGRTARACGASEDANVGAFQAHANPGAQLPWASHAASCVLIIGCRRPNFLVRSAGSQDTGRLSRALADQL